MLQLQEIITIKSSIRQKIKNIFFECYDNLAKKQPIIN